LRKDRSRWEIILDVLEAAQEEKTKKTRIMQRAYLDFRNFNRYFDFLQQEGFIANCDPNPGSYELTENGRELLRRLREVGRMLARLVIPIILSLWMLSSASHALYQ